MGLIRALLALSVILNHSESFLGLKLVGGAIAVQAFFIISGFYMALILNEKYIHENGSYKLFISNRFLRIYPIYWVVFLLVILSSISIYLYKGNLGFFRYYSEYWDSMSISTLFFLVISNISLFFQDIVLFLGLDTSTGELFFSPKFTEPHLYYFMAIPQAWSVSVELVFYLIAPFIARKKVHILVILALLSFLLRFFLYSNGLKEDPWSYRFFATEFFFFFLGIIAYHIYKKISKIQNLEYSKYVYIYIVLFLICYSIIPINESFKYILFLSNFFLALPFIFLLSKKWKKDRYIGDLSYPMYISHIFILSLLSVIKVPPHYVGEIGTILTIIFSVFLNEFIAKKIELYRQKRVAR